ncbi:hypothetical protein M011DRAFT_487057 [Sporormia fimetaria CBS 119925]|uniref:Uncharacterized protein n=1 Tax=Sporormia fimetaria CBS 119925 TaxID=1340428 RepID=A0A6A6VAT1_9PLEO|nr:hypothetical protein M011DRAFT_487057 [Sporormia fimetaria CBS 119925]
MHFTTPLFTLLLTATTALAAPSDRALAARQSRIIYARFFGPGGCEDPWVEDVVFNQANGANCVNTGISIPHKSVNFLESSSSCVLKIYNRANCDESGNHQLIQPGAAGLGCQAFNVQSAKFLC